MNFSPAGSDKPVIAVCTLCDFEATHIVQVSYHSCPMDDGGYPDGHFVNPEEAAKLRSNRFHDEWELGEDFDD